VWVVWVFGRVCVVSEERTLKCSKCGGEMRRGSVSGDFRIRKEGDLVGDQAHAFYCRDCGFVELFKEPSTLEPWRLQRAEQVPSAKEVQQLEKEQPPKETSRKKLIR